MKLTRFTSLTAFALLVSPAGLLASDHTTRKAGKLKSHPAAIEEQITCTAYPEWTCYPSGVPAKPETAEERAARELEASRAAAYRPLCTSYPEWTCLSQGIKARSAETRPTETVADPGSRASAGQPNCTSYPERTCSPQANEAQGSKKLKRL